MNFEFLIPKRPVSLQTKNRSNLQIWKAYIQNEAAKTWNGNPYSGVDIHLILVYLYDRDPVDADNIIKPIQDALVGLVYEDDLLITDVESHRRSVNGTFDLTRCSSTLIQGIISGTECVYTAVGLELRFCTIGKSAILTRAKYTFVCAMHKHWRIIFDEQRQTQ